MRQLVMVTAIIAICIVGCSDTNTSQPSDPDPTSRSTSSQSQATDVSASPDEQSVESSIPKDVSYTIVNKDIIPGIKRGLDIRLNKKVSEKVLHSIAVNIKKSDSNTYERTFIGYYLPGMELNAGAWATTHFNPDLEVRILGLTEKQEQNLEQNPKNASRKVIGAWLDERPFMRNRVTIFRKNREVFMKKEYEDGSNDTVQLIEKESPLGQRFDEVGGSAAGEHWVIDSNDNLQLRDDEGMITTMKTTQ